MFYYIFWLVKNNFTDGTCIAFSYNSIIPKKLFFVYIVNKIIIILQQIVGALPNDSGSTVNVTKCTIPNDSGSTVNCRLLHVQLYIVSYIVWNVKVEGAKNNSLHIFKNILPVFNVGML